MSINPEFKIGDKVIYWCADKKEDRVIGIISDVAMGGDLCDYEEQMGYYDEDDDACEYEHDSWYYKVKPLDGTEEVDWSEEYYWRIKE